MRINIHVATAGTPPIGAIDVPYPSAPVVGSSGRPARAIGISSELIEVGGKTCGQ